MNQQRECNPKDFASTRLLEEIRYLFIRCSIFPVVAPHSTSQKSKGRNEFKIQCCSLSLSSCGECSLLRRHSTEPSDDCLTYLVNTMSQRMDEYSDKLPCMAICVLALRHVVKESGG